MIVDGTNTRANSEVTKSESGNTNVNSTTSEYVLELDRTKPTAAEPMPVRFSAGFRGQDQGFSDFITGFGESSSERDEFDLWVPTVTMIYAVTMTVAMAAVGFMQFKHGDLSAVEIWAPLWGSIFVAAALTFIVLSVFLCAPVVLRWQQWSGLSYVSLCSDSV